MCFFALRVDAKTFCIFYSPQNIIKWYAWKRQMRYITLNFEDSDVENDECHPSRFFLFIVLKRYG